MSDGGKGSNRRPENSEAFKSGYEAIFGDKKPERGKFIWDEEQGKFIPASEYVAPVSAGPAIIPDIQPYISQIDGSVIQSRSRHRTHLRDNGCIEIGNEKVKPKAPEPPKGLRDAIGRAVYKHLG